MVPFKTIIEAYEERRDQLALDIAKEVDPGVKEELRRTLNVAKQIAATRGNEYAQDAWGNRFTYMVSRVWTKPLDAASPALGNSGSIRVLDSAADTADNLISKNGAQFAVISHGVNGDGARGPDGRMLKAGCTGLGDVEMENCDRDATIVRAAVSSAGQNNSRTDDMVAYNISFAREVWQRVSCGTDEMCLSNRNAENVAVGAVANIDQKLTVGGIMRAEKITPIDTAAKMVCDDQDDNCFAPSFIGGNDLNKCDDMGTPPAGKRYVAKRVTGVDVSGATVPQIKCELVDMPLYNKSCTTGHETYMRAIASDGSIDCYDPCMEVESSLVEEETSACPGGMHVSGGVPTFSTAFDCAARAYDDYEQTGGNCVFSPYNGQCGTADNKNLMSGPVEDLCLVGKPGKVLVVSDGWKWTCEGEYSGADASCDAKKPVHGS
jgi:hypothetical protein